MNTVTTTRLNPLGRCMYCDTTDGPLTDEHILARGLNGDLLLPESSCRTCQTMIGREIETPVLKNRWLSQCRLVLGFRSYKPNRQPTEIKMTFVAADGTRFGKKVPKSQAVAAITLPHLIAPRALTKPSALIESDGIEIHGTYDTVVHNREATQQSGTQQQITALCQLYGAWGIDLSSRVSPTDLCRFLAKTAYGYHVATRGLVPRDESPALAVLKGEQLDLSNWVGGEEVAPASTTRGLHTLGIEDRTDGDGAPCTVVTIRLFNANGVHLRYVVVTHAPGWKDRLIPDPNPVRRSGGAVVLTDRWGQP